MPRNSLSRSRKCSSSHSGLSISLLWSCANFSRPHLHIFKVAARFCGWKIVGRERESCSLLHLSVEQTLVIGTSEVNSVQSLSPAYVIKCLSGIYSISPCSTLGVQFRVVCLLKCISLQFQLVPRSWIRIKKTWWCMLKWNGMDLNRIPYGYQAGSSFILV